MAQIDVRKFLDKRIYAKKATPIYRSAFDDSPVIFTVKAGSEIGICYSYLLPRSGRSETWLMFYDKYERAYYCPLDDKIDLQKLADQGVKDDKTTTKEREATKKSTADKIFDGLSQTQKTIVNVLGLVVLGYGIHEFSSYDKRARR
jgi:hypothetical protein